MYAYSLQFHVLNDLRSTGVHIQTYFECLNLGTS